MSLLKAQELLQLALLAAGSRGVTLDDICEKFECVPRSAQRKVDALQTVFPAIQRSVDPDRKARWVLPARAVASLLTPSAEELTAMSEAIRALEHATLPTEANLMRQLESKVRALIPPTATARLAVDEEALALALGHAVRPGPRHSPDLAVDQAIYRALKGPSQLRFLYQKGGVATERTVEPHGLLLGIRRYLVARDIAKPRGGLRHYDVEKISEAEVLEDSFVLDSNFNIDTHCERAFGSYEDEAEYGEVVWKFTAVAAPRARQFVFHPTQTFEDQPDGSLIVRFRASGHLEMSWYLYAWGTAVEVIAPARLRAMVEGYRRDDFAALP